MYTLNSTGVHGVAGTFTSHSGMGGWSIDEAYAGHVTSNKGFPRRITPIEAERLQGFPDGYTDIYDKTPDTPRYKALGNSMAVPVMRWIGSKIDKVDKYDY